MKDPDSTAVDFHRLVDQWAVFPTTMQETLLTLIRLDIAKRCYIHGKVVQWQRAEAYVVQKEELRTYAEELAVDLREAEEGGLIPDGYFDEGSPTEPEDMRSALLTILAAECLGDDGGGVEEGGSNTRGDESERSNVEERDEDGKEDNDDEGDEQESNDKDE